MSLSSAILSVLLCLFGMLFDLTLSAQVITTFAGTNAFFQDGNKLATTASLGKIRGVTTDAQGNVIAVDADNSIVVRIGTNGILTVLAGSGISGFSGDGGSAQAASLNLCPGAECGIAIDGTGNVFVSDSGNNRVRKISVNGIITTIAGGGSPPDGLGDGGPAIEAALGTPSGLAIDSAGNLYIADSATSRVRRVDGDGLITTVAGGGTPSNGFGDGGPAIKASLSVPEGIAVDSSGNLFICDVGHFLVRKVDPAGNISTVLGPANPLAGTQGNIAVRAAAVDSSGNLYLADFYDEVILKMAVDGTIQIVAGNGTQGFSGDGGKATSAQLSFPFGVSIDSAGNIYIADYLNSRVREVTPNGIIQTIAGNGDYRFAGDAGPAVDAVLNGPQAISLDPAGELYIADTTNQRIRKVGTDGIISTVVGTGTAGYSGDGGQASEADLYSPIDVELDAAGNLYILDSFNSAIRQVSTSGIITTFTRTEDMGLAVVSDAMAVSASGTVYYDDINGHVNMVSPNGATSVVAGVKPYAACTGDNGPAVEANLGSSLSLAVDQKGQLYISSSSCNSVRMVGTDGIIHTILSFATGKMTFDQQGNLYAAVGANIVKVSPSGTVVTLAGNGKTGFAGDGGPATSAELNPSEALVDPAGNLYIADPGNNRIREVLSASPPVLVSPAQLQFTAASNGAPAQPQTLSLVSSVNGLAFSVTVPGDATWLQVNSLSGTSPRQIQVVANPAGLAPTTYQSTLTVNVPNGNPSSISVTVSFAVTAPLSAVLSVDEPSLSFPFPMQGSARSQTITVSNGGSGTLAFAVAASTNSGGNWLSASPASGQVLPGNPVTVAVTANPAGLAPGAYSGQLTVTAGAQNQTVSVTMTIGTLSQAILLSQSGLSFLAVRSGGVIPAQSFAVMNIGSGVVNWSASTTTLTGGNWLQVTPASGSSDAAAGTSPRVTVNADASQLAAGVYYGLVRVNAPGAANSPQVLTVFLQVLPSGSNVPPAVQPAQLTFTATAGSESPGSQTIQVYNIVGTAKSFQSQVSATTGLSLIALPQDATLDPQRPTNIVVQPITSELSAGVYDGTVTLQFSDGTVSAVLVSVIVSNNTGAISSARGNARPSDSGSCQPSKLVPQLISLGASFQVSAGWPAALLVNVEDDCGNPMPSPGSVRVSFSNGDPEVTLLAQGNGSWESTWQTGNAAPGLTLTVNAAYQSLTGNAVVNGSLASQQQPPAFPTAGIVSAATAVPFTSLAPGSAISIYGGLLAESSAAAQSLPLPAQIGNTDTQVFVSGTTAAGTSTGLLNAPLYYVSPNQLNVLIPYEVGVDTSLQLLVQRGPTLSLPIAINMAPAQPSIFSTTGAPGGAGLIQIFPAAGGAPYLASASTPAHVGDTIVAYCAGLGAVNPAVADGGAPGGLSGTVSTAQLIIGGQSAPVSFSGLTPGFAGLYQVNAVVPTGVQTGSSVPVTLSIAGQTSPAVTIAIQ